MTAPASPPATLRVSSVASTTCSRMRRADRSRLCPPASDVARGRCGPAAWRRPVLERLNVPGQRRLRHVQPLGGAAEIQVLGDSDKAAKLDQGKHRYLISIMIPDQAWTGIVSSLKLLWRGPPQWPGTANTDRVMLWTPSPFHRPIRRPHGELPPVRSRPVHGRRARGGEGGCVAGCCC